MSSDIRDLFNLQETPISKPVARIKPKTFTEKKPDSITRELYSLLGENTPPIAILQNKFKTRPKLRQKAVAWVWSSFVNGARKDGHLFSHWIRAEDKEYRFEKLNKKVNIITYSNEEYALNLTALDWSREETDYLFSLCREYDLRFVVIADRYDYKGTQRTMEDIKDRYYTVVRKVLMARTPIAMMTPTQTEELNQLYYNKEREIARKKHLASLAMRTPAEIAEEEALFIESQRIEAYGKKMAQERKELLRLLEAPIPTGSIAKYTSSQGLGILANNILNADKSRKRKIHENNSSQALYGLTNLHKDAIFKKIKKLSSREESIYGVSWHEKLHAGIYLRSTRLNMTKPTIATKIATILTELGLATRLTMPTTRTCAKFEQLQRSIEILLDAKKHLDRLEQEHRVAEARVQENPINDSETKVQEPLNDNLKFQKRLRKKYPNERATHVLSIDTLRREVDPETGVLRTERLIVCRQSAPLWILKFVGGNGDSYVREVSEVDPRSGHETLTMRSANLTFSHIVSVEETVVYRPAPHDPLRKTLFEQEATFQATASFTRFVSAKMEEWSVRRFSTNAKTGREGFEGVLANMAESVFRTEQTRPETPYH
ncbi:hypothetical protein PMAC_001090 [Pneumocystis sp. 'macacae']|nr:hypothetical protein PMAC_001090 [Pneumocystis sp. 'macacae']